MVLAAVDDEIDRFLAFAGDRKYDGWQYRRLTPSEMGQIAGRAGRHVRDGTFGTTGRRPPFDEELVEALQEHRFDPIEMLQWRNSFLDFSSSMGKPFRIRSRVDFTRSILPMEV